MPDFKKMKKLFENKIIEAEIKAKDDADVKDVSDMIVHYLSSKLNRDPQKVLNVIDDLSPDDLLDMIEAMELYDDETMLQIFSKYADHTPDVNKSEIPEIPEIPEIVEDDELVKSLEPEYEMQGELGDLEEDDATPGSADIVPLNPNLDDAPDEFEVIKIVNLKDEGGGAIVLYKNNVTGSFETWIRDSGGVKMFGNKFDDLAAAEENFNKRVKTWNNPKVNSEHESMMYYGYLMHKNAEAATSANDVQYESINEAGLGSGHGVTGAGYRGSLNSPGLTTNEIGSEGPKVGDYGIQDNYVDNIADQISDKKEKAMTDKEMNASVEMNSTTNEDTEKNVEVSNMASRENFFSNSFTTVIFVYPPDPSVKYTVSVPNIENTKETTYINIARESLKNYTENLGRIRLFKNKNTGEEIGIDSLIPSISNKDYKGYPNNLDVLVSQGEIEKILDGEPIVFENEKLDEIFPLIGAALGGAAAGVGAVAGGIAKGIGSAVGGVAQGIKNAQTSGDIEEDAYGDVQRDYDFKSVGLDSYLRSVSLPPETAYQLVLDYEDATATSNEPESFILRNLIKKYNLYGVSLRRLQTVINHKDDIIATVSNSRNESIEKEAYGIDKMQDPSGEGWDRANKYKPKTKTYFKKKSYPGKKTSENASVGAVSAGGIASIPKSSYDEEIEKAVENFSMKDKSEVDEIDPSDLDAAAQTYDDLIAGTHYDKNKKSRNYSKSMKELNAHQRAEMYKRIPKQIAAKVQETFEMTPFEIMETHAKLNGFSTIGSKEHELSLDEMINNIIEKCMCSDYDQNNEPEIEFSLDEDDDNFLKSIDDMIASEHTKPMNYDEYMDPNDLTGKTEYGTLNIPEDFKKLNKKLNDRDQ